MGWIPRRLLAVMVAVAVLSTVAQAQGAQYADDEGGHSAIVWVGTVATNLFYIPAKTAYACAGGLVGGLGWILTGADTAAAEGIWGPTVRGTWVLTPSMFDGNEDVRFVGP